MWAKNDLTRNKYGSPIKPEKLPLSQKSIRKFKELNELYSTYLDWNDPGSGCNWTTSEKNSFLEDANILYNEIVAELGNDYVVINEVATSVKL